MTDVLLCTDE